MYSAYEPPEAISHRGLRRDCPENSIPAFRLALAAGAEAIELDVHASADGVIYVHHDFEIVTDVPGSGTPSAAIADLDSKSISASLLAPEIAIPTLDDVIAETDGRAVLYIEIKATGIEAMIASCLRRHPAQIDTCAVHAFDHRIVKRMAGLMPALRTGVLQASYAVDSCALMRAAGASDLWQRVDFIDQSLVTDVRACGGRVIAWTANAPDDWRSLSAAGVHAICTDKVDEYVKWRADSVTPT